MATTIERVYQLIIDAGGSKAGAEMFRQSAEKISAAAQKAAAAGKPIADNVAQQTRAYERLRREIDPLYSAEVRLAQGLQLLETRFRTGQLGAEEMARDVAALKLQFDRAAESARRMGGVVGSGGGSFRHMGMAVQQAGFQVGDFAVQVAGGQGALRAFIQQFPQLLGVVGGVGSKMAMFTSIAGAAVAVAGALAMTFWDLDEATEEAGDALDVYVEAMRAAEELTRALHGQNETTIANLQADRRYRIADTEAILAQTEAEIALIEARELASALQQSPDDIGRALDEIERVIAARVAPLNELINGKFDKDGKWVDGLRGLLAELKYGGEAMDPFAALGTDNTGSFFNPADTKKGPNDPGADAIASLQQQIALYGDLGHEEKALYETTIGRYKDESAAEKEQIVALARILDLKDELTKAEKERLDAAAAASKAEVAEIDAIITETSKSWESRVAAGAKMMEEVRTPLEAYMARISELNTALAVGTISQETYNRQVERAQDAFSDASESAKYLVEVGEQAFDRIGAAITEAIAQGKIEFASLRDVGLAVVSELWQAFFELSVKNPLKNLITGGDAPDLTSVFGGIFDSLFNNGVGTSINNMMAANPSIFHRGGIVGGPAPTRAVSVAAFADAPRFHNGRFPGLAADEIPAILQEGEIVLPKDFSSPATAQPAASGQNPVVIVNDYRSSKDSEPVETRTRRGSNGQSEIEIILRDRVRKMVREGELDREMSSRYGHNVAPAS